MRAVSIAIVVALLAAACAGSNSDDAAGVAANTTTAGGGTSAPASAGDAPRPPAASGDLTCWAAAPANGSEELSWNDVTADWGLIDPLTGMHVHAAAWGDVNGDLAADLVVGTFATARGDVYATRGATGPSPDRLLLGGDPIFATASGLPEMFGRTSGAVFVDLDNDGDDDLVLSRNVRDRDAGAATSDVLRNDDGTFVAVGAGLDPSLGGRSVGVLDVDEDGLLDLIVIEDRYRGGSSRIYRNEGGLQFSDVTTEYGFGGDVHGLGIATGDLNNDRHTDVFVAGSNRLFVGTGAGLAEVDAAALAWETFGNEDDVSGAAIADVNRDGWLDLVVGHHYNSTLSRGNQVPVRLYVNRTSESGETPQFEDVTDASGLIGLPTKAPHVEIADLDNDGWPDILTSASASGGSAPAVFMHIGLEGDLPGFAGPAGLGEPQYWVGAPTADVDRDGRLDVLLLEWEPSLPSLLLANTTASGAWLEVSVGTDLGGGVGTRVDVYQAGAAGDAAALLGSREIVASLGYTTGVQRIAHFGLGDVASVDVVVTPPFPHHPIVLEQVAANQHIRLPAGCG